MTNLGFLSLWTLISSSSPHLSFIFSSSLSISFLLPTSIITFPSLSDFSEVIPTLISVGFTFAFNRFCISSGEWFSSILSNNLNFLPSRLTTLSEYSSFVGCPSDGSTCLLVHLGGTLSLSVDGSSFPYACVLLFLLHASNSVFMAMIFCPFGVPVLFPPVIPLSF